MTSLREISLIVTNFKQIWLKVDKCDQNLTSLIKIWKVLSFFDKSDQHLTSLNKIWQVLTNFDMTNTPTVDFLGQNGESTF